MAVLEALVTAGVLGLTHAIEPDHVAGISSRTSEYGSVRLSALAGACFSVGHVALVVLWLGVSTVVLPTIPVALFETISTVGVGVLLFLLGSSLGVAGLSKVTHRHSHRHADEHDHGRGDSSDDRHRDETDEHDHYHLHLPAPFDRVSTHDHERDHPGRDSLLRTSVVGALFSLSPPLSMIGFVSLLLPEQDFTTALLAVGTYAVSITLSMSLLGVGSDRLFDLAAGRSRGLYGSVQIVVAAGLVALSLSYLL